MNIVTDTALSQLATRLVDGTVFEKFVQEGLTPDARNGIFRGIELGTAVTDDQWEAISDGTFENMYIGDYWTIDSVTWRIAAFDYYYNQGDTACTTHHAVIVPDSNLTTSCMNESATTEGAYVNSYMYTTTLPTVMEAVQSVFGESHILSHRLYLTNAATAGYSTGGAWTISQLEIMNEYAVCGAPHYQCMESGGGNWVSKPVVNNSQFPLFRLSHRHIQVERAMYWLRDICSSSSFAFVTNNGAASWNSASISGGVRPAFSIC